MKRQDNTINNGYRIGDSTPVATLDINNPIYVDLSAYFTNATDWATFLQTCYNYWIAQGAILTPAATTNVNTPAGAGTFNYASDFGDFAGDWSASTNYTLTFHVPTSPWWASQSFITAQINDFINSMLA